MSRLAFALIVVAAGCGQQLVEFSTLDFATDQSVGDLAGVDAGALDAKFDFSPVMHDLSFPFDLAGDMTAPCHTLHLDGVHAEASANGQSIYNASGAITVEGWVYQTAHNATESVVAGHWGDPSANTASYVLELDATGHVVFLFATQFLGATTVHSVTSTSMVPLGTWMHVAGQFTPGVQATITVYLHGAQDGSLALGLVGAPASVNGVPLSIGRFSAASSTEHPYTGFMHDVRISSTNRYPGTPTVRLQPDAQTIALYHFDEASGSVAADVSTNAIPALLQQNAMFESPPMCP